LFTNSCPSAKCCANVGPYRRFISPGDEEVSVSVAWTTVVHSRKVGAFRFKAGAFDSIAKAERVRHRTFQRGRGTTGCVLHGLTD
jgi:hypothetical protein